MLPPRALSAIQGYAIKHKFYMSPSLKHSIGSKDGKTTGVEDLVSPEQLAKTRSVTPPCIDPERPMKGTGAKLSPNVQWNKEDAQKLKRAREAGHTSEEIQQVRQEYRGILGRLADHRFLDITWTICGFTKSLCPEESDLPAQIQHQRHFPPRIIAIRSGKRKPQ